MKKLNKTTRLMIITYIFMILWGFVIFKFTQIKNQDTQIKTFEHYTVQQGDTLWSIAQDNPHADLDIREFIYDLERMNGITPQLQIGSDILIPIYDEE